MVVNNRLVDKGFANRRFHVFPNTRKSGTLMKHGGDGKAYREGPQKKKPRRTSGSRPSAEMLYMAVMTTCGVGANHRPGP